VDEEGFVAQPYVPSGQYIPGAGEFFDRLSQVDLPAPIRTPIWDSLTVLLEDDGETRAPNTTSFRALLRFLDQHRDLPPPSIGITPAGYFSAGWQDSTLRFTLEFMTAGYVRWVRVEDAGGGKKRVSSDLSFIEQITLPERIPRNIAS
jgi:hypothetical protein